MTKGKLEKQMMKNAEITPCREHAYTIKTCDLIKIFIKARKECPVIVTKELVKVYKELAKNIGLENLTEPARTVLWVWDWFGDKK